MIVDSARRMTFFRRTSVDSMKHHRLDVVDCEEDEDDAEDCKEDDAWDLKKTESKLCLSRHPLSAMQIVF